MPKVKIKVKVKVKVTVGNMEMFPLPKLFPESPSPPPTLGLAWSSA